MASVQLRKNDKTIALNNMTEAKFKARYDALMKRRVELTKRVYDMTLGKEGNKLKASAKRTCDKWAHWLGTKSMLGLVGVPVPGLIADPAGRKLRHNHYSFELFSGKEQMHPLSETGFRHSLPETLAWPSSLYEDYVRLDDADAQTKRVAKTLTRDIEAFNKEVREFYDKVGAILDRIRSSKKVDEMFPELWDYLPVGLRERVKQGIIPLDQREVDEVRKMLPTKSKRR